MDDRHPLYARGPYRVIAWMPDGEGSGANGVHRFAVVDDTGMRIRDELTLDDARGWIDRRIEDEQRERAPSRARRRERR